MNTQRPERPSIECTSLDVHSIFPTIQGEGPLVGKSSIFVRLAGCNLKCPSCDTEYTKGRERYTVTQLFDKIEKQVKGPKPIVVITGGEPFRQNLSLFVDVLLCNGYTVQIETNGTLEPTLRMNSLLSPNLVIVCSPKTAKVDSALLPFIKAYKYVIDHNYVNVENGLPLRVLGMKAKPFYPPDDFKGLVYVQPMDAKNEIEDKLNLSAALNSVLTYDHVLCLQIHKIVGIE